MDLAQVSSSQRYLRNCAIEYSGQVGTAREDWFAQKPDIGGKSYEHGVPGQSLCRWPFARKIIREGPLIQRRGGQTRREIIFRSSTFSTNQRRRIPLLLGRSLAPQTWAGMKFLFSLLRLVKIFCTIHSCNLVYP